MQKLFQKDIFCPCPLIIHYYYLSSKDRSPLSPNRNELVWSTEKWTNFVFRRMLRFNKIKLPNMLADKANTIMFVKIKTAKIFFIADICSTRHWNYKILFLLFILSLTVTINYTYNSLFNPTYTFRFWFTILTIDHLVCCYTFRDNDVMSLTLN